MNNLPSFNTKIQELALMQSAWATALNPLLRQAINNGILLEGVPLVNGSTVVNHLLDRKLKGFIIADINGAATIYRSAPKNDKTLTLTSNAAVVADIWVF